MSGLHGFGNWALSFTARMLFFYGIHDSQSGMWVFRKEIMENPKMRPTNDGMPLSEEMKINARRCFGRSRAVEVSVPYRPRVGTAEIHTWGGWLEELQVPIRQEGRAEQGEDSLGAGELVL